MHRALLLGSARLRELSQHLLDQGYRFCALYADLANPTSNHVYRALGFQPICDANNYAFLPLATP